MADARGVVIEVVALALGAGLLRFLIDLAGVRRSRRLEPDERGNVVAQGAEKAVASMKLALDAAEQRIEQIGEDCRLSIKERDDKISRQDAELVRLRDRVTELTDEVRRLSHTHEQRE